MKIRLFSLILLLFVSACGGIDKEKAKEEFQVELEKISNPLDRQRAMSQAYKICGDFQYLEMNSSKNDAREFRSKLSMTILQEKGTKAICPRYW